MKQQIIEILNKHRPPMIHPTNRSGGDYAVACEVDRILDEVIKEIENMGTGKNPIVISGNGGVTEEEYKKEIAFLEKNFERATDDELDKPTFGKVTITPFNLPNTDKFKCKDCSHTLVRTRGQGMYCGICKK